MNNKYISYRCPHCGKALEKSEVQGYAFQCKNCDEDFYNTETAEIITTFSKPDENDLQKYRKQNIDITDRMKITVQFNQNIGETFILVQDYERFGETYIKDHVSLTYSPFFECWYVGVSEDDYYNDPVKNPEKTIPLELIKIEREICREVYKGIEDENYYLRSVSNWENIAAWLIIKENDSLANGLPPKPNTIFKCGSEIEKVVYRDYNGVCAYSDTFNCNFGKS